MTEKGQQPMGHTYKYKRLYDLGSDRLNIIESMLTNGDSPMQIARHIQTDWGECTDVKTNTLEKQLQRYRNDVLDPKIQLAAERAAEKGTAISTQMKKFRDQVDVGQKLNEAMNLQWTRIEKAYTKEANKGEDAKLDPAINKELRAFTDVARALASFQLETGVVRRVPKQVQGFFAQLNPDDVREFRVELEQNDRTLKALSAVKDVINEAASEVIDGEYVSAQSDAEPVPTGDAEDMGTKPH